MQAPGGPREDARDGFECGGWIVGYWDEEAIEAMRATMAPPFDLLLGRSTYEIFVAHWPYGEEVGWKTSVLVANPGRRLDPGAEGGRGPELQVEGQFRPPPALIAQSLVDRLRIWTFPLLLGKGGACSPPAPPQRA